MCPYALHLHTPCRCAPRSSTHHVADLLWPSQRPSPHCRGPRRGMHHVTVPLTAPCTVSLILRPDKAPSLLPLHCYAPHYCLRTFPNIPLRPHQRQWAQRLVYHWFSIQRWKAIPERTQGHLLLCSRKQKRLFREFHPYLSHCTEISMISSPSTRMLN